MAQCPTRMTQRMLLDSGDTTLDVMVDPASDRDGGFKAWCNDQREMLFVRGWMIENEEVIEA